VYDGIITLRNPNCILLNVDGACVYVHPDSPEGFEVNQIVKVRVTQPVYHMLNYSGELLVEAGSRCYQFEKHRLYRNVPQGMLQHMLQTGTSNVLLRKSAEEGHCVLACRMPENNLFSYKLREDYGVYYYERSIYETIDKFIEDYVKKVYALAKSVVCFKHFYSTAEEAQDYVSGRGKHAADGNKYIRYAVCFSVGHPGYIEFLYAHKCVLVRIDKGGFVYRHETYSTLDHFISFAKRAFI